MDEPVEIHRHDVFAVPVWATNVDLVDREAMLGDVVAVANTSGGIRDLDSETWTTYRSDIEQIADRLAKVSRIGWRERTVDEWAVTFASPGDIPAERDGIQSHARATFSTALWLAAPAEAGSEEGLSLSLRNPFSHLTRRYKLPTYVHHPAVPGALLIYPSFLEQFFETRSPTAKWSGPAIVLLADFHYY